MTADTHDFSPEEQLERKLRAAMLEKDYPRAKELMRGQAMTNDFKGAVLNTAVQLNAPDIVRFVFEEEKVEMQPETGMMFLLDASKQKHRDVALYLCEQLATGLGLVRSDPYMLLLDKFPAEEHEDLVEGLLETTADRQDALDKMLFAAAETKNFALIPALIDKGADVNADSATVLYTLFKGFPKDDAARLAAYEAALDEYLSPAFEDRATLDTALVVAAMQFAEGGQSEKAVEKMLALGADPCGNAQEAEKIMVSVFTPAPDAVLDKPALAVLDEQAQKWRDAFKTARDEEAARNAALFETLYGDDYRPADLLAPAGDDGDTGLMIAAKAKRLGAVISRARKTKDAHITLGDLAKTNERQQSCLSLAVDRGDLAAVLNPAYWLKQEPELLQKLDALLTGPQKQAADMPRITAHVRQEKLVQKASRLRLQPRPAR
ncbi:MAG: hypothetical protein GC185_07830 [Alphaproteobacteria bacterium]|nr:hypothetical protein [Alphaproteobacteria bacterium]